MFFKENPAIAIVLNDEDVLSLTKKDLSGANLVELRVDMFKREKNIEEVFSLAKEKFNLPLLCTVRLPEEGGKKRIPKRLNLYESVIPFCDFFDIEIMSKEGKELKNLLRNKKINLIGSYHCFSHTPSTEELEIIYEKGKALGMDIIKLATMVNDEKDLEVLLLFTLKHKKDNVIVIGMGEKGIPSRIVNPLFGSLITYASIREISAPGQIHLKEMVQIFKIMGIRK